MSLLYIEPFSGISGDMFLAALAPLADAEDDIVALPDRLGLAGVSIRFVDVSRSGILCRKVEIDLPEAHGGHGHRHLSHIEKLIEASPLDPGVKRTALDLFRVLGEAEAAVHGIPIERVHFHEVGALDSILDIVGAAVLIHRLGVTKTYCDPVCTGFGFVQTAHGRLPVPAPATERLLQGMPTYRGQTEAELVTPTGAAILRYLAPDFTPPAVTRTASSWGAGTKEFSHPNALRVSLCAEEGSESLVLLQTNVDDMTGEELGADFLGECLRRGALDAWLTPIIMKKGRPAFQIEALCPAATRDAVSDYLLEHTSTLGVRILPVERRHLARATETVETSYGPVRLKVATLPSGARRAVPEYEDCRARAEEAGVPLRAVYAEALGRGV